MALTDRCKIPYPEENADPYFDTFADTMNAIDSALYAAREDRNLLIYSTATFTYSASAPSLTWDQPIFISSPITGYSGQIAPGSIALVDTEAFYVTLTRNPQSSITYMVALGSTLPNDVQGDNQYMVGLRVGTRVYFRNGAIINDGESRSIFGDPISGVITTAQGGFGTNMAAANGVPSFAAGVLSLLTAPTGALMGTTATQTVTGKTMSGASNTFSNIASSAITGLPTFPGGTIVGTSDTQTLTAKTMSGASNTFTNIAISTAVSGLATGIATFLGASTSANLAAAMTDETGSGALVFATSPTLVTPVLGVATGTSLVLTKGAIGATSTDGLSLTNTTASTTGTTAQWSTRLRWLGTAYNSVSTLSETQEFWADIRPSTAAGATSSAWTLASSINGGAATTVLSIVSNGTTTVTGQLSAPQYVASAANGFNATAVGGLIQAGRAETAGSAANAFVAANLGAAAAASQRWSPSFRWSGAGWNVTAAASHAQDIRAYLLPVQQSSGEPTAEFTFEYQVNSGGYATLLKLLSQGGMQLPTASATPANPPAGSVSIWFDGTNLKAKNSAGSAVTWA